MKMLTVDDTMMVRVIFERWCLALGLSNGDILEAAADVTTLGA